MATKRDYEKVLEQIEGVVRGLGMEIIYTTDLDEFFKGDLDGMNIMVGRGLPVKEKLFNVLHLAGHNIQWNLSTLLHELGSEIHQNPSDTLIRLLQTYEYEANCYALQMLIMTGNQDLERWLELQYKRDMLYLTHFYKTGEKVKEITDVARKYLFDNDLIPKEIPVFKPRAHKKTRNGIVINFTKPAEETT